MDFPRRVTPGSWETLLDRSPHSFGIDFLVGLAEDTGGSVEWRWVEFVDVTKALIAHSGSAFDSREAMKQALFQGGAAMGVQLVLQDFVLDHCTEPTGANPPAKAGP